MSIRTNPMKAVPTLLKRLVTVEKHGDLKDLKCELIKIKDLFSIVKKNEDELLDTLTVVDGYIRNSNVRKSMKEKEEICKRIRISTQKLLPCDATQSSDVDTDQSLGRSFQANGAPSLNPQLLDSSMIDFKVIYDDLELGGLFLSLSPFPKNEVIKQRNILFWWETLFGLYSKYESLFNCLLYHKIFVPHANGKCPVVKKVKIDAHVYRELRTPRRYLNSFKDDFLILGQKKVKLGDEFGFNKFTRCRAVFNFGASYLNFRPQWTAKMGRLEVLQLGRWVHDSASHHIEVESEQFLKELKGHKYLRHLGLRGISRISVLPPSVFQLESLETLDIKACHNLTTLPYDIASLKNLKHLDFSHCYLLDRVPMGIEKLTNLQVLKGFVIGRPNKTHYKISDLTNLKNLERLSIRIESGAVIQEKKDESLIELSKLQHLKISWGVSDTRYSDMNIILPSSLRKLNLEGFPGTEIPEWLKPSHLQGLDEIKIVGGKLKSINHGENNKWSVTIVRLKYLKHLEVDLTDLQKLFPILRYVEIKKILSHSYFERSFP